MPTVIKRCISLLLILMLVVSLIPSVYAAETADEADPAASSETTEETPNTEPEENLIPPPDETEPPVIEESDAEPSELDIIDDSEPPVMLLIDGEVALASISNCQATTWATIWVNTDEYSPIAGKTNRFIYYEFAGKSRNRNNVGLKAIKVNGTWQAAYCLEPGIAEGSTYTEEDLTMDEFVSSSAAPSTLTVQQMKAMCVAVMYGQRTLPQSASYELLSNMVATQIIVWEIAIGWRNATPPYAQTNDAFIRRFENSYGKGPEATSMYISIGGRLKNVISSYNQISANMVAHSDAIPSFTSAAKNAAPTIDLKPNGSGLYSAAITDSYRVISGYSFPKMDGLTFSTNGNLLTITSDRPLDNVLVEPTRNRVNAQGHPFFVWYNGSYQVMLGSQADPSYEDLPVYFRVRAVTPTGSLKLVKETNTGKNLDGWQIGLYTDAARTKPMSGSPFTTGADGSVTVSDLSVGTLYAKEIEVDDPYWVCDTSVKTVNITAGQTATVTFRNTHYGDMRIRKNAVNGSAEGWSFQIMDSERNLVTTIKTGADGYAHSGRLLPGQYFILEVCDRNGTYWEYDPVVEKQVTITAGSQAEVAYTNTQYGKIQIQKAMETVGSLTGWQFRITDSSGTEIPGSPFSTDETGLILSEKLQPGEYKVEELIPENSLYSCTSENPQTVTAKAGETAGVSFTNALRPGGVLIEKVDIRGEPLADAKFLLEWSKDGSLWWPVEYTDTGTVREGFCFNAKCVNGTLTSGKNGLLEWTGLHPGLMYRVTELEAPKGYSLLTEPAFEGILPADNLTVSFRVVNCEIFKLPDTGVTSGAWLRVSQFACILLCTALLVYSYRRERRQ